MLWGMRIGELASLVGVSTRAVRHYHATGVLPEPQRRSNGYRDYSATDLIRLLQIVRLSGLGLTLAEVRAALEDERDLRAMLADVVADIEEQQAALDRRRHELIALIAADDGVPASPEVAALLAELAAVAPAAARSATERDLLELMHAATPAGDFPTLADAYQTVIGDERAVAAGHRIDRQLAALADADPDDPRVAALAADMVSVGREHFTGLATSAPPTAWELVLDTMSPAQRRCLELAAQGWESTPDTGQEYRP